MAARGAGSAADDACDRVSQSRPPSAQANRVAVLRAGSRDLGYVEGKNIVIEFRWTESEDQLSDLADDLVRTKLEIILVGLFTASRYRTLNGQLSWE